MLLLDLMMHDLYHFQEVQRQLCRALTLLLDAFIDKLAPHLPNIVEFMLMRTQVKVEKIRFSVLKLLNKKGGGRKERAQCLRSLGLNSIQSFLNLNLNF